MILKEYLIPQSMNCVLTGLCLPTPTLGVGGEQGLLPFSAFPNCRDQD